MRAAAEVGSTANRYQILAKLAVGGMAEIFLARGDSVAGVERYCVLKRILRERASDEQLVRMFVEEARLAAQLQHPNIASVYDVGTLGDSYFFTMEYVHGETVRGLLHRAYVMSRPVPLACAMTVIAGAAAGLHHAHERVGADGRPLGIVHRDVSPSNLMIGFEGHIKLVDFGVAKAADRENETRSGTVKGKISYLSPEQCRGIPVDRRSDVFSLGIVMWEMLTGARLFRRASDFENMTAIVHETVPRPSTRRPDIPRAIDDIVMKMLAKDLDERYQTADAVVEAIENASMRAGTLLSTSAVSRLMRDLFGTRPEPWRELESVSPHEVATVMSQPISEELARQMRESRPDLNADVPLDPRETDEAEPALARVPDLSLSTRMAAEPEPPSVHQGFDEEQTAGDEPEPDPEDHAAGARADEPVSLPTDEMAAMAMTPPPELLVPVVQARPPTAPSVPARARRDLPLNQTVRDPRVDHAPTVQMSPADLLANAVHTPRPSSSKGAQSTLLGVGPEGSAPGVPPPTTFAPGFAPTFNPPSFGAPVAQAFHPPTFSSAVPAPSFSPYPHNAPALALPAELPTSSDLIPLPDGFSTGSTPILPEPSKPRSAILVAVVILLAISAGAIAAVVSRGGPASHPAPTTTPAVAAPAPTPVAPTPPAPAPPTPAPTIPTPAPTIPTPAPTIPEPAPTIPEPAPGSNAPIATTDVPSVPTPPSADEALRALRGFTEAKDYAGALGVCSTAPTAPDIARLCTLAACYRHEATTAKRWFARVTGRRAALVASCKQASNLDLAPRLDCTSNPLDCR